nr:uncharacterized protein LOC104098736 isoform X2 [Nicotiana tomentosiformis]
MEKGRKSSQPQGRKEIVRTRTTSTVGQELKPPIAATTRGRGRGKGRAQPRARAAAPTMEPQIDHEEENPTQTAPVGPTQVPGGFIATPLLQDALVHLVGLMENVAQTGAFSVAPTIS